MIEERKGKLSPTPAGKGVLARVFFFFIFFFPLFPPGPSAQVHVTGLVEIDSNFTTTTAKTGSEENSYRNDQISQNYLIGLSGIVLDPRFASYSGSVGFQDTTYKTKSFDGQATKVTRDNLTYSLQMTVFPRRWPLSLYAQRNIIGTEAAGDVTADTFSLSWIMSLRNLPTLRVTLLQFGSDFEDPVNPRETRVRIANIGLNHRMGETNLDFSYQLQNFMINSSTEDRDSTVNSFTFRGETNLRKDLFAHTNLTYFPEGSVFAPGLTSTSETAGGVGILHQIPSFSQSANYQFFDTSGTGDTNVERNILSYNINYRPLGKTDYHGDLVYSDASSSANDTADYRVSGGLNHRPFFGLSLSAGAAVNRNESSGQLSTSRDRFGTNLGINYFQSLTYFHFNSGAALDYSITESDEQDEKGEIWTATGMMGLTTRTLNTTQVNGSYTLLHREDTVTGIDNRDEHAFHLGVLDSTFRRLTLKGSTDLQFTDGNGIHGTTFVFDTKAEYFPILNLNTSVGYRYSDFPDTSGTQDVTTYFAEGRYFLPVTRNFNASLSAHWDRDSYRFIDRDRYLLNSLLVYQLGKIVTSVEYRNEVTIYPGTKYTVESVFLRASRPF